jgi:hypothetical protein
MLPNFLCLGAQKSGTTTLLQQLGKHPDIYMSPARETRFFLHDHLYSQGVTAYETEFFSGWSGEKCVGEKTPEYLCDPAVPARIRETLGPDMKFIVTLRSPAQRAYAQYRQNFQFLREDEDFEAALGLEPTRCARGRYDRLRFGYLWRGRYAEQLERYLALYPTSSFFFCIHEQDIAVRQRETLAALFSFLGVDAGFDPGEEVSAGRAQLLTPRIIEAAERVELHDGLAQARPGDILLTRPGIKPRLVRHPSDALLALCKAALTHMPAQSALPRERELQINRTHFHEQIRRLESLIGRRLASWME